MYAPDRTFRRHSRTGWRVVLGENEVLAMESDVLNAKDLLTGI